MLRRRLFAYTVMMTCGIICGYLMCEMSKVFAAAGLLISIGVAICKVSADNTMSNSERKRLFTCLIAGVVIFAFAYIDMNSNLVTGAFKLHGTIKEIKYKDYGYEVVVKPAYSSASMQGSVRVALLDEEHNLGDGAAGIYGLIGDKASANCELKVPSGKDNPEGFDYRLYLRSRGIKYTTTVRGIEIEENKSIYHKLHSKLMESRNKFEGAFDDEPELRAMIKGVIFGDKNEIDAETREEFNENGTGHLLAVSGLHIGFLFTLLEFILRKRRTFGVNYLIIAVLIAYGEMTMWSPSTVRAVMVMVISLLSTVLKSRADLLTSVSFAALALLVRNPYELFNTGFIMSFVAMLGIAFFSRPLSFFIGKNLNVILAVQLANAPLTAILFHRFNPLSAIINVPITLIAAILVPLCITTIGLITIIGIIPGFAYEMICGLLELLLKINHSLNSGGNWSFDCREFNVGILIVIYVVFFLLASEWMRVHLIRKDYWRIREAAALLIIPFIIISVSLINPFADDEIVFVSVGQGDATHVRCGRMDVLIDGGGNVERNVGKEILKPYLLSNGASDVDIAMLTHLHTDHYKGIEELSEIYPVKEIELSNQYSNAYEARFSKTRFISSCDRIRIRDDCYIQPIWPIGERSIKKIRIDDANEFNMVYMVFYRGIKIMVTGDLLEQDELEMVQYYERTDILKCDILKVAHHGSKSSSSEALLDAAAPKVAVISVGANNMYGHPHKQTLERLEARSVEVYRTDVNGAIGIDINRGGDFKVDLMR